MKNIILNYIKDRVLIIVLVIMNSVIITSFYKLTISEEAEIIYPMIITVFLLICYLIIDGSRYIRFNKDILRAAIDKDYNIRNFTNEQKQVVQAFNTLNFRYIKRENEVINTYKEKQHFIANAIHKFKNYISVISLIIEKNKYSNEAFIDIEKENDNLYSALEQALSYIRLDAFSNDFEIENIDLTEEIRTIINENKQLFINNEVFPLFDQSQEIKVCTDRKWNRIIIEQLITNGVKYSLGRGNIKFNIEEVGETVTLKIKDEGIGIPSYDIKRVFEAFFTGENGRRIKNSSGIGLYISKEVSKKLGNEIRIKSEVNKGTEVSLTYLSKL